ncbi:hypothetical protein EV122DRAFT_256794 [Schizophyllum commune]
MTIPTLTLSDRAKEIIRLKRKLADVEEENAKRTQELELENARLRSTLAIFAAAFNPLVQSQAGDAAGSSSQLHSAAPFQDMPMAPSDTASGSAQDMDTMDGPSAATNEQNAVDGPTCSPPASTQPLPMNATSSTSDTRHGLPVDLVNEHSLSLDTTVPTISYDLDQASPLTPQSIASVDMEEEEQNSDPKILDLASGAISLQADEELVWECGVRTRLPRPALTNSSFPFVRGMAHFPNARTRPDMVSFLQMGPETNRSELMKEVIAAHAKGLWVVVEGAGTKCQSGSENGEDPALDPQYWSDEPGEGVFGIALDTKREAHDMAKRARGMPSEQTDPDPDDEVTDDPVNEDASEDESEDESDRESASPNPYVRITVRDLLEQIHDGKRIRAILDIPSGYAQDDFVTRYLSDGHQECSTVSYRADNLDYDFRPADIAKTFDWLLLHQAGFLTYGHADATGMGTTFDIRGDGAKLWLALTCRRRPGTEHQLSDRELLMQSFKSLYFGIPRRKHRPHQTDDGAGRVDFTVDDGSLPARVKGGKVFHKKPLIALCLMVLYPRKYIHAESLRERIGKLNDEGVQEFLRRLRDDNGEWVRGPTDRRAQLVCLSVLRSLRPDAFRGIKQGSYRDKPQLPDIAVIRDTYLFEDSESGDDWQDPGPVVSLGQSLDKYIEWVPSVDDAVLGPFFAEKKARARPSKEKRTADRSHRRDEELSNMDDSVRITHRPILRLPNASNQTAVPRNLGHLAEHLTDLVPKKAAPTLRRKQRERGKG